MRMVFGLVLVFGLALAGAAVYMVQGFVSKTQSESARDRQTLIQLGELVDVFLTKKPLAYGDPITKDGVIKVRLPKKSLPENYFSDPEVLFPGDYAEPRYVIRQMEKFEPLLAVKITEPGEDVGLTARLPKGKRAFAIKVDVASGVSGFVQTGDNVDIYWTGSAQGSEGDRTQLIESAIKVLAVDQAASVDRSTSATVARTVTVEATPQQVGRLAQAQATGRLALALVGNGDETVSSGVEIDSAGLLGIEAQAPVRLEQTRVCSIKTRRGAEMVEVPIPCTN